MTCLDCIHFELCNFRNEISNKIYDTLGLPTADIKKFNVNECSFFKEKTLCIELLCKVGDKVFIPDRFGRIEAEIEQIEITEDGVMYQWVKYDRGVDETEVWDDGSFEAADIGKTVYLTFEEYEKHFAERNEDEEV